VFQERTMRSAAASAFVAAALLFHGGQSLRGKGMQSHAAEAIDYNASYLIAVTGTAGMFAFAGHRHAVLASAWSADLNVNLDDLTHSSATITAPADKLVIDSPTARQKAGLGKGPGDSDVRTIQKRMLSNEVLDAAQYPQIRFTSTGFKLQGSGQLQVTGNMQIHGRAHPVTVQVKVRSHGRQTEFDGEFNVRQTDYGIEPESVAGGMVKVKDSITIKFHIVMTAAHQAAAPLRRSNICSG
jgi:polyisoprenoid-binding protein YceI